MISAPRIRAALGIALLATSFCLFLLLVAAASAAGIHGGIVLGSALPVETVFDNSGSPWPFLNQVAAVNYRNGGQGLGYNVSSPGCSGAACTAGALAYRPDDVNFKAVTGVTGFPWKLGFNVPTAAYNYSVTVATTGRYQLNLLGASGGTGGTWGIILDGTQVATASVPNTGSYETGYTTFSSGAFNLVAGNHVLTLNSLGGDSFNSAGDIVWIHPSASAATFVADFNDVHQTVDGFGASDAFVGGSLVPRLNSLYCVNTTDPGCSNPGWLDISAAECWRNRYPIQCGSSSSAGR